MLTQVQNSR